MSINISEAANLFNRRLWGEEKPGDRFLRRIGFRQEEQPIYRYRNLFVASDHAEVDIETAVIDNEMFTEYTKLICANDDPIEEVANAFCNQTGYFFEVMPVNQAIFTCHAALVFWDGTDERIKSLIFRLNKSKVKTVVEFIALPKTKAEKFFNTQEAKFMKEYHKL